MSDSSGSIRFGADSLLVFNGTINPGNVCDLVLPLAQVAEGYRAMDERRAIKTLLRAWTNDVQPDGKDATSFSMSRDAKRVEASRDVAESASQPTTEAEG